MTKLFTMKFPSNSTCDDQGPLLPDIPSLTEPKLWDPY